MAGGYTPGGAIKIFIQWEKRVGLQFAKYAAQFLLNSVDGVEEIASIHAETTAAQAPVSPEEEVKLENPVLGFIEGTPGDQAKIGDVLLVLPPPCLSSLATVREFKGDTAHVFLFLRTVPEARVAGAENPSQNTVTGVSLRASPPFQA
jgi:hypothetical protein